MKRLQYLILLVVIAIGVAGCGDSKQDPMELFIASDLAANKNETAQFTITFENLVGEQGQENKFSSKVSVAKLAENPDVLSYRIEEEGKTTITFNGKSFTVTDVNAKTISSSSNPEMAAQLAENLSQSFYMIIDNKLDTAEIKNSARNLEYLGKVKINGENFYEVSQKADGHGEYNVENHYFFSADDKLMKKYTSKIFDKNKKIVQSIQFQISDLKVNEKLSNDLFVQKIDSVNFTFKNLDDAHAMGGGEMMGEGQENPHAEEMPSGLLPTGSVAPDWSLLDSKGNKVTLSKLKGKVVVLDFWATWCNPCKRVMPSVQKLHEKYASKGVMIYGVNAFERDDAVKYMKDNKFTYGLLLKGDEVATKYKVESIPTMYVIDKSGKIILAEMGASPDFESKLESAIKKAL